MSFPSVIFSSLVIVIVSAVLANAYPKLDSNHLWLDLDANRLDYSRVEEKWIEQRLDHYDASETRTFRMKYLERLDFWQPGGPIIIGVGGESALKPHKISYELSILVQMAEETNGALLATEHRYYGDSVPDIPDDDKAKYYTFLSSQQALADIEYLIRTVKSDPKYTSSKVVVVGGSYAGNLAAWLRVLYPGLVDAAVAASAPVLAKKDFKEYLEVVAYAIGTYGGAECLKNYETKFKRQEELLKSFQGNETIKKELNICPYNDLTVLENQQYLFTQQYDVLKTAVQHGNPSSIRKHLCDYADLEVKFIRSQFDLSHGSCFNVDWTLVGRTDPWTYQFCSEFGYLQTTTSEKQPFVRWSPLEFNLKYCRDLIKYDQEQRIDDGVAWTNQMYGGKYPNVTKVVFTHGDMDPWHPLGVLEDLGPDAPVIMVNGTSHCAIMKQYEDEPEELTKSRKYVIELIKKWISTS